MANTPKAGIPRTIEDLVDARNLRAAISAALLQAPMNENTLRHAVWSFVGTERRAGIPPALVITRLTGLIDGANISPRSARLTLTRRVILWCVEEYFGRLGGEVFAGADLSDLSNSTERS